MKPISNPKRAFTLVELLVVISIIALLAALTVGLYSRVKSKAVESTILAEMEQVKLALQSYKEDPKHGGFPPSLPPSPPPPDPLSGTAGKNRLYYYLSGEAELVRHFGGLAQFRTKSPAKIRKARMEEGIKNLLPNLKLEQFDAVTGSLYSPVADKDDPAKRAQWIYESVDPSHNRETYDLSVKILDVKKVNGVYTTNVVKEIGNW